MPDAVRIALSAFFTFGCITIYEARQHAKAMTPLLALTAVCLGLLVAMVALAERPGAIDRETAVRRTTAHLR